MTARELVEKIQDKCPAYEEVECIVVKKDGKGSVVCIEIVETAKDMKKLLEMFSD